jgi:hypothetical protein
MPISVSMIVVSSQLVVAVADRVPEFDIARSCKLDLAATAGLSEDQSMKACVSDEKGHVSSWGANGQSFLPPARQNASRRNKSAVHPAMSVLLHACRWDSGPVEAVPVKMSIPRSASAVSNPEWSAFDTPGVRS